MLGNSDTESDGGDVELALVPAAGRPANDNDSDAGRQEAGAPTTMPVAQNRYSQTCLYDWGSNWLFELTNPLRWIQLGSKGLTAYGLYWLHTTTDSLAAWIKCMVYNVDSQSGVSSDDDDYYFVDDDPQGEIDRAKTYCKHGLDFSDVMIIIITAIQAAKLLQLLVSCRATQAAVDEKKRPTQTPYTVCLNIACLKLDVGLMILNGICLAMMLFMDTGAQAVNATTNQVAQAVWLTALGSLIDDIFSCISWGNVPMESTPVLDSLRVPLTSAADTGADIERGANTNTL